MASQRQCWVNCRICFAGRAVKSQGEVCKACRAKTADSGYSCGQCGDRILGKPGYLSTETKRGWCGSPSRTKTWAVCQDCTGAGEYQQHLYRLRLQAEMAADLAPKALEQGQLF